MCQTSLEMILAKDYLKYREYANIPKEHNMSYLRPKGVYLVNYIEQLFLRLFDDDIDEFIDTNNLRGTVTGKRFIYCEEENGEFPFPYIKYDGKQVISLYECVDLLNSLNDENKQLKYQNEMLSDELEQCKAVINKEWSKYLKKKEKEELEE